MTRKYLKTKKSKKLNSSPATGKTKDHSLASGHGTGDSVEIFPCNKAILSELILASHVGSSISYEESIGISEAVFESDDMIEALCDYLDEMTHDVAKNILDRAFRRETGEYGEGVDDGTSHSSECSDEMEDGDDEEEEGEEDGGYIQNGECELCEREMKLTRHHLIPKRTWKNMTARFLAAAPSADKGDMESVYRTLDLGDDFQLPTTTDTKVLFSSRLQIKLFLSSYCANLCRPCHSCVHGNIDHYELAERYNSVDALLKNEQIYNFCKWASKQKSGKYRLSRDR